MADTDRAEIARLHTWAGLISLLDEHYPPGVVDGSSGDPGPRIVALTRELDRWRALLTPRDPDTPAPEDDPAEVRARVLAGIRDAEIERLRAERQALSAKLDMLDGVADDLDTNADGLPLRPDAERERGMAQGIRETVGMLRALAAAPTPAGPKAGDRVEDGGEMGTLVRCDKCGGGGLLHDPDELPPAVEPIDLAAVCSTHRAGPAAVVIGCPCNDATPAPACEQTAPTGEVSS